MVRFSHKGSQRQTARDHRLFYEIGRITNETHAVIESYGMESDGNATSWLPVDEYFDTLDINEFSSSGCSRGWLGCVEDRREVDKAKEVVENVLRQFVSEVQRIRNLSGNEFVTR